MSDSRNRAATARALVGADVHRTRHGYTLTLHRKDGVFPVLAANGRQVQRWRRLDGALAYLAKNFAALSAIRLNLDE